MHQFPRGLAAATAALLVAAPLALAQNAGQDPTRPAAPGTQRPATPRPDPSPAPARGQVAGGAIQQEDDQPLPDFSRISDQEFCQQAAIGGLYEVTSSRLVQGRTQSQQLQQFAQRMIEDHNRANRELMTLAEQKRIELGQKLDARHQRMIDRLTDLKGAEFDREYLRQQTRAHVETVALFQAKDQNAQDADLKAWVGKTLPILQHHLEMAQSLSGAQPGGAGGAVGAGTRPGGTTTPRPATGAPGQPGGVNRPGLPAGGTDRPGGVGTGTGTGNRPGTGTGPGTGPGTPGGPASGTGNRPGGTGAPGGASGSAGGTGTGTGSGAGGPAPRR